MAAAILLQDPTCPPPPADTLSLGEQDFDQSGDKGWRPLARPGCFLVAAELIRRWRAGRSSYGNIVIFHEAQMRAAGMDYAGAAPLFLQARAAPNEWRVDTGWNAYVEASAAFVRRDLPALRSARARLAALPVPAEQPGVAEAARREPRPALWPPNLDVVDGLLRCFERPYADALQGECRNPSR